MESRSIITNPSQTSLDFTFSCEYKIRRSKRAKYMRINAHPANGIEVVVPTHMSLRHVDPFVQQHQDWINKQIINLNLDQPRQLPDEIHLQILNKHWGIDYLFRDSRCYRLKQFGQNLTISGPDKDIEACINKLRQWLRHQAKLYLPARLASLSERTSLTYNKVTIRSQRSRWGSCSSAGNISLNDRLMFLPSELADYVILHELCHTRQMNHSPAFWQLVKMHSPDYKKCEKQLKSCRQYLPHWL